MKLIPNWVAGRELNQKVYARIHWAHYGVNLLAPEFGIEILAHLYVKCE